MRDLTMVQNNLIMNSHNITFSHSIIINKPPVQVLAVSVPTLMTILLVNILSIKLVKKRESTLVNNLLILDCVANTVLSVINVTQQFTIVGHQLYCAPVTVLYSR